MAIALRLALYGDLTILFGVAAYGLHAGNFAWPLRRGPIALLAAVGLLAGMFGFALSAAAMVGGTVADVDGKTLAYILQDTPSGRAFLARTGALALLLALCARLRVSRALATALSAVALGSLAWSGHAAASEGWQGTLHRASDVVHLLAAGAWLGALFVLLAILALSRQSATGLAEAGAALARFGVPGTVIVALLVATGAYNLVMIVGLEGLGALPDTLYGRLLLAKLALFVAMLVLAASNRWRLTPRLERSRASGDSEDAARALRRSIRLEAGAATLILLLVAWLGMLDPMAAV